METHPVAALALTVSDALAVFARASYRQSCRTRLFGAVGLFDLGPAWPGYAPLTFCTLLHPMVVLTYGVAVALVCTGVIIWVVSMGKSEAGIGLALGGVMLFILPLVLPHYLGAECIPQ